MAEGGRKAPRCQRPWRGSEDISFIGLSHTSGYSFWKMNTDEAGSWADSICPSIACCGRELSFACFTCFEARSVTISFLSLSLSFSLFFFFFCALFSLSFCLSLPSPPPPPLSLMVSASETAAVLFHRSER